MSNVVSMERTCDYLVRRAASCRRKKNYDGAMTLLVKARDRFGLQEEIEMESARVYEEIECEEEAARAYLRVVRLGGKHCAQALFQLALSAMQSGDLARASSYYDLFMASDRAGVSAEYAGLLGDQLIKELEKPLPRSAKGRAAQLRQRAVACIHAGRTTAARRALTRAYRLRARPQTLTLHACCALMDGDARAAIEYAAKAHDASKGSVQPLLVLADAYSLAGEENKALRALYLAAMRAKDTEDTLACALESAKRCEDQLTLLMTRRVLKAEPFHTRAMMMRACALTNLGRYKEAGRLFGRVCVLMPENTVSEALFRAVREGEIPEEKLTLGLEVPYQEGTARAAQLVAALYMSREDLQSDRDRERMLCRYASWAFRSQLAGDQVSAVAMLAMMILHTPLAEQALDDALTDPAVGEGVKTKILQLRAQEDDVRGCPVDLGGRLVHLAAGGVAQEGCDGALSRQIVQQAADALLPAFTDAPKVILELWLAYLRRYGAPGRRHAAACACALELAYHTLCGHEVSIKKIARRRFVSPRLCRRLMNRMLRVRQMETTDENGGIADELHQL